MQRLFSRLLVVILMLLLVGGTFPDGAGASHSWKGFHWARTSNPARIQIIDSMSTTTWRSRLDAVNADWNTSAVLENPVVAGSADASLRKQCPAVNGKIRACNSNYGATGWLGLAAIHTVGPHIVDGTVKMNNYYFAQPAYSSSASRRHVYCQEMGHVFGLDHNRTAVTCMNDVAGANDPAYQYPNAHDYNELQAVYSHLDGSTTIQQAASSESASTAKRGADPVGKPRKGGGSSEFVADLGNNEKIVTFVAWADSDLVSEEASGTGATATAPATKPAKNAKATSTDRQAADVTTTPATDEAPVATEAPEQPAATATEVPAIDTATEPAQETIAPVAAQEATVPAAPTDLVVTVTGNHADLQWTDQATDETAYRVDRSTDGGQTWKKIAKIDADSTQYRDRGIGAGTNLIYRVAAVNAFGASLSEPVSATVP